MSRCCSDIDLEAQTGEFVVAGRAVRLRQVDAARHDRGAGKRQLRRDPRSADRMVNGVAPKDRDIAMVFQSYALYPTMTVRREHHLRHGEPRRAAGAAGGGGRAGRRRCCRSRRCWPQAGPAFRRPAAARGDGPRAGARPGAVPVRRAAVQPRRQAARRDAHRDQEAAPRASRKTTVYVTHDQVEAMTLASRIAVMHRGGCSSSTRPRDGLRPAGQHVRRRLHGLAGDEFPARRDRPRTDGRADGCGRDGVRRPSAAAAAATRSARRRPAGAWCWACGRNDRGARRPRADNGRRRRSTRRWRWWSRPARRRWSSCGWRAPSEIVARFEPDAAPDVGDACRCRST